MIICNTEPDRIKLLYQGFIACIPTALGYLAIGFACGAIGRISGFDLLEIILMGVFLYAGSAQFLFYSLAGAGAGVTEIALAVAFINMRYLLINTYMAQFFSGFSLVEKLAGSLLITDETFGVASYYANRNDGKLPFPWLLGLNLTGWFSWILATIAGCIFAAALPAWLRDSMGFSLVGMFVALLLFTWFGSRRRMLDSIVMAIAILVILCAHNAAGSNIVMLIATLIAATAGMLLMRTPQRRR